MATSSGENNIFEEESKTEINKSKEDEADLDTFGENDRSREMNILCFGFSCTTV